MRSSWQGRFVVPCLLAACFAWEAGAAPGTKNKSGSSSIITSKDASGREYATKGYIPMKAGPGTRQFQAAGKAASGKLPPKVDMRGLMTRIEDQGETSSCVANAIAGAYEYWVRRSTKQDYDVSRLFVYYNARWRNGDQDKDDGSVIQLAMDGLREFGACAENRWPFEKPLLLEKPNRSAYEEASKVKIKEMNQVPLDLNAWKQAIASGYPVVFGILLFESFDQCNQRGGVVPMPSPEDVSRESHGGHAMTAVGYSDKERVFIVRNSWGDRWGDQGYCYMPYDYVINDKFNGGDSWVFIPENPIENTEDIWFEDEEPVTDGGKGVDFVINTFTVDDYEDIVLTWWEEYEQAYNDVIDEEYLEYVEYVEEEEWDQIESFDYEEIVEEWEEEHPGEDSDLYVYDEEIDESSDEELDEYADEEDAEEEEFDDADEELEEEDEYASDEDMDDSDEEVYEDDDEESYEDADDEAESAEYEEGEDDLGEEDDYSGDEEMDDAGEEDYDDREEESYEDEGADEDDGGGGDEDSGDDGGEE